MPDYKKMYMLMMDAVEKAVKQLMMREVENALNLLTKAKQDCEDIYVGAEDKKGL